MIDSSTKVLEAVRAIVMEAGVNADQGETVERTMVQMLAIAWCASVRAEWQTFVDADPELKAQHAVALELMREDRYDMDPEPICGLPGAKPPICRVDGVESVCVDWLLAQVTPLSAIYVNKVRLVQSAAARVAKALAEEAVKTPPEWPLTIASGETFNSIEEMEQCPIDAVKEMAKMMRDAGMAACHPGFEPASVVTADLIRKAAPLVSAVNDRMQREYKAEKRAFLDKLQPEPATQQTCWQFFGFDGPVGLDRLEKAYLGRVECESVPTAANAKLAAGAHLQYQNCLKDLANAMNGPVVEDSNQD